jgi:prepilin-type N-terminal cleavage/methylation domain-containing protein
MDLRQFPLVIETDGRDARERIRMAAEADGEAGFTLVEVVVALTILLLVAIAFIPLFIYITQGSQASRMRVAATAVATGVMEEIRALPYDRVGTVGGNPAGDIEPVRQEMINGVKATVKVRVWWVDDFGDDEDSISYDCKKVQVTVTAPGFTGKVVEVADIRSLVAREAGEAAYPVVISRYLSPRIGMERIFR